MEHSSGSDFASQNWAGRALGAMLEGRGVTMRILSKMEQVMAGGSGGSGGAADGWCLLYK